MVIPSDFSNTKTSDKKSQTNWSQIVLVEQNEENLTSSPRADRSQSEQRRPRDERGEEAFSPHTTVKIH